MHNTAKPIFLVTRNARQREQQPEASAALLAENSKNYAFITLSEPALADTDSARITKQQFSQIPIDAFDDTVRAKISGENGSKLSKKRGRPSLTRTEAEQQEAVKAKRRKYGQTEKGKQRHVQYNQTEKGKQRYVKFNQTEQGKERFKVYDMKYYKKNRNSQLQSFRNYYITNKGKEQKRKAQRFKDYNTDHNHQVSRQSKLKRQRSQIAGSSHLPCSQDSIRTAVDDPKYTVRVFRVQEPSQVNSDPTLFYFAGACPIEKNAFIGMMRAIGIRVTQRNRSKATVVQCETEPKTYRYVENDIYQGQTVITYGEFFARNIKVPLIPEVKFVVGVGTSEQEIFLYRKKMDLWEKGTGKWYKHTGSDTDVFQGVYIEKQFLFAWQYAIHAKRESRDINYKRRRILYSAMARLMARLAVGKALDKLDRCLFIHCFDKNNTRQFYPKESDYAGTVPFTQGNKLLPSKFELKGKFMLEYMALSNFQKMLMLCKVCDDLESKLTTYNILEKLPAGHKEKAHQFKNIPVTERNNTVFNLVTPAKKKQQPSIKRLLPLKDRNWGGKPLKLANLNQPTKILQKVQSDDEETDEEQIRKNNAIVDEQLRDLENYTRWEEAKMPDMENGGEDFFQDVALREINQKHMKYEHRQDRKLLGKRPFQKRKPAQLHSCDYHDKLIQTKENSLLEASIGDKETDKLTRRWLFEILNAQQWNDRGSGTIIELMAGYGRNLDTTKNFFKNIEMLDGSSEMTKYLSRRVIRHQCKLEEFEWPNYEKYDCILGVFCLGYLTDKQILEIFSAAKRSLKAKGKLIMLEPVAYRKQLHEEKGQKLWIRNKKDYEQLLFNTGYELVNEKLFRKECDLSHDLHSLVWIKSQV